MKRTKIFFLLIISLVSLLNPKISSPSHAANTANKVILMSWDGTQRNHLNELLSAGKLPNLQNIINQGAMRNMVINTQNCGCTNDGDNYHTETGPAHAAMLSGYGFPTAVNHSNWDYLDQCEGNCPSVCPEATPMPNCPLPVVVYNPCFQKLGPNPIPKGLTIFERLKAFNPNIKTALITGKAAKLFPFPALKHAAPTSCCYRIPDYQDCGDNTSNPIDSCQPSNENNTIVGNRFGGFLDQNYNTPFFLFAHLKQPDDIAHLKGENSLEYSQGIIDDDIELGKIVQKLKDLGIYEQTIILVTTDHGMAEGGIALNAHHVCVPETKNIWIASNKKNVIDKQGVTAKQTSIVPTIFDIFGISKNVTPPFAGESLFNPLTISPTPTTCPNPLPPILNLPTNGANFIFIPNLYIDLIVNPVNQQCGINSTQYLINFTFRGNSYGSGWTRTTWHTGPYNYTGVATWKAKSRYFDAPYNIYRESVDSETRTYNIITPSPTPTTCSNPPAPVLKSPANGANISFIPNLYVDLAVNQISQRCGLNQAQYLMSFTFRGNTYSSPWAGTSWHTGPYNYAGVASWKAKSRYFDTPYNVYRESVVSETRTYNIITPTTTSILPTLRQL